MRRLLVSAAHKSSGKTTVSVGLAAALTARGLTVQPFKKGPDYIDPLWLGQASGRTCRNLDPYLMRWEEIGAMFERCSAGADVSLVEGNKGLYDGLALDGSNSNAALASHLGLPVVLVIDARGMTRGIAPLILGYQAFDREIRIAGVILNNVGGPRHEAKLRAVVEHYTDVPVLGAVQHDPRLAIAERHLGLMPSNEADDAAGKIAALRATIGSQIDLDAILAVAGSASPLKPSAAAPLREPSGGERVRIGIAFDRAFGFYYPDDLDAISAAGGKLVPFDTLRDAHLPAMDGLIVGGGFPELFMHELEANASLRADIRAAIEAGLPAYAECGGLMYLAGSLSWQGCTCVMVGAIPGDVVMHERPVGRGYVEIAETPACPWPGSSAPGTTLRAHEFHYSSLENVGDGVAYAFAVKRGHGIDGRHDGLVHRNLVASYVHRRSVGADDWAARFVAFVRQKRRSTHPPVAANRFAAALAH
ncbi:MAG TPA: cobyrinate a,c-diamide synthase [Casimicrobiaceae bacterium]|jgi:cobyrinic acid a,c-diamide synthase|nr:cobyrinate a,c-diamide synthase [Casimicrobiaceae bacterium]